MFSDSVKLDETSIEETGHTVVQDATASDIFWINHLVLQSVLQEDAAKPLTD